MAATALTLEVSREADDLIPSVEASGMNLLALRLWQRGSRATQAAEQDWLTPEECILIPH